MSTLFYIPIVLLAILYSVFSQKDKSGKQSKVETFDSQEADSAATTNIATNPLHEMSTSKISLRPFTRLGGADHGWLNTRHHFSFADYFDMNRMHWGALRVINDDIIESGSGFPPHPHRCMEIVTYVLGRNPHPAVNNKLEGGAGIKHGDNHGNGGITEPGDVQVMSVGSDGVVHSEFHPGRSIKDSTNILQIWIMPDERIQKSTWGTRHFPRSDVSGKFVTFASGFKKDQETEGALPINSFTRVVGVHLNKGDKAEYKLDKNRLAYAVVTRGSVDLKGLKANAHDGIAIDVNPGDLNFEGTSDDTEVLMVDTHPIN